MKLFKLIASFGKIKRTTNGLFSVSPTEADGISEIGV